MHIHLLKRLPLRNLNPEVDFRFYGSHLDISSKFGMQTDFHLLKRMQSLALNTEVAFGLCGRHLEKSIWRQKSADVFSDYDEISQAVQHD